MGICIPPLVDQSVFAENETVVAHADDKGFVMNPHVSELLENPPYALVHSEKCLAIAFVILFDIEIAVIGEIDAVPAVALVPEPPRFKQIILVAGLRRRFFPRGVGIDSGVASGSLDSLECEDSRPADAPKKNAGNGRE